MASGGAVSAYEFDHLTLRDGLANSSISAISQDADGFLWFASQSGLHRYDGYEMKLFTARPFDTNSLTNQLVQSILMEPGTLWVGTYTGINRLDLETERITSFVSNSEDSDSLSNDVIVAMARDGQGRLWAGTLDGLNRLDDAATGRFTRFAADPDDPTALPHATVRALYTDSAGRFWVGSYGGLSQLITHEDGSVTFDTLGIMDAAGLSAAGGVLAADSGSRSVVTSGLRSAFVMSIAEDDTGRLWLGTWGGGLVRFDPETRQFEHFAIADDRVYTVLVASSGKVFAGTWGGGLFVYDPTAQSFERHQHDVDDSFSLSHDIVYSIFEDRDGVIWIGTNGNGVNKLDPYRTSFRFLHPEVPIEHRIDSGKVQALGYHPQNGDLYIGLQNNGLNIVSAEERIVRRYRHDPNDPSSISTDTINAFFFDDDGTVLVATHVGINRYYPESERFEPAFTADGSGLGVADPIVYQIVKDDEGLFWFGTYSSGIFRQRADGSMTNYRYSADDPRSLSNNLIYTLFFDRTGALWAATNGGLNRYDAETDAFERFLYDPADLTSISGRTVAGIAEDSTGDLWFGTRSGGINVFDRESQTFRHLTTADGLSSNAVVSIAELDPGTLYVATVNGLNAIDTETQLVRVVDEQDGLFVREFSTGMARSPDGALLFGAFSEVVRVERPLLRPVVQERRPAITGIRLFNEPLATAVVAHALQRVELDYDQNFISISYSGLDFFAPQRSLYRYRLTGVDADWVFAGSRREATYTNLPPGKYQFQVSAAGTNRDWSPAHTALDIVIAAPFWQTLAFRALVSTVFLSTALALVIWRDVAGRRRNAALERVVAARTQDLRLVNESLARANGIKDRFFSIVSHDLRGPVGSMAQITDAMVAGYHEYSPAMIKEMIGTIAESSAALYLMIENLFTWAAAQSGRSQYRPVLCSVAELVGEAIAPLATSFKMKGIDLTVDIPNDLQWYVDEPATKIVVENLIGNALKFTERGGSIKVEAAHCDGLVEMTIADTGIGIDEDRIADLFSAGNVTRSIGTMGEKGSGFGLSLCRELVTAQGGRISIAGRLGEGTTVRVALAARPAVDAE